MRLKKSSEKIYIDDMPSKIRKIQLFDNDKFVFVAVNNYLDGVVLCGENYVTSISSHTLYTGNFEKIPPIGNEEYYQIISYDIQSDKEKLLNSTYINCLGKIICTVHQIMLLRPIYKTETIILHLFGKIK